jgi:hypothetical protein
MSIPTNKTLYNEVKAEAKKKYRFTSLCSSAWIQREYKRRGGTFSGTNENKTTRWFKEKWVQVIPFLKSGKVVECSADTEDIKACRPLHRISDDTPITLPELLDLHPKSEILVMARKKNKNANKSVKWDTLEFH